MELTIPDSEWEEAGEGGDNGDDPTTRLTLPGGLYINGTPHHVEAWAVSYEDGDYGKRQVCDFSDESYEHVFYGVGGDDEWMTTTINGREYVIIITPFCQ